MIATVRADAHACFAAALAAVDARAAVARHLARDGQALVLHDRGGRARGRHEGPVLVVGAGKAAAAMAHAVAVVLGPETARGMVIAPHGSGGHDFGRLVVRTGAHPVPDAAGAGATADLLRAVRAADAGTLVLVVLSGGASALLVAPAEGISLGDKQEVTRDLVSAGAEVRDLNAVRKHCSLVKGGGLARAGGATAGVWTLVLSDVVGDDLATVASGPTVADPTTYADALAVLARHAVAAPAAIHRHLERGARGHLRETAKQGEPAIGRVRTVLVGNNTEAVRAARAEAARRGYRIVDWPAPLEGNAGEVGRALAEAMLAGSPGAALIAGGETTVRARPGGVGGRSQHLALAAALALAGTDVVLLAAGTDGVDGPTDAAGACVDGETIRRARALGFDPEHTLAVTDSHRLLAAAGDLLRTGPTGTNVADLVVALRAPA